MFKTNPEVGWRYVFLMGLLPAAVALLVRSFIKEPDRWKKVAEVAHPKISELFSPEYRRITLSGFAMALVALVMWWSCNAFISNMATWLAQSRPETTHLAESWKALATNCFNIGGLIGTLLTVPIAKYFGRRPMYLIYFLLSAASIMGTFGLSLDPHTRLYGYFFIGLSVFGVFGSFTYYLPELFPTRLRATGSGFCYNAGRVIAAIGPFVVGSVAARGTDKLQAAMSILFMVGFVPLAGLLLLPWVIETKHRELVD
jgi:MFS family permease